MSTLPRLLPIKLLRPRARLPAYAHAGDSGMDCEMVALRWPWSDEVLEDGISLQPGRIVQVFFGWAVELPEGFELQIRGRSGQSKRGLWVALGTVDQGYRGEVGAVLANVSSDALTLRLGDRVAQAVVCPVERVRTVLVAELGESDRGESGWGSTGIAAREASR